MAQENPKPSPVATAKEGKPHGRSEAEERLKAGLGGRPGDNPQLRAIERAMSAETSDDPDDADDAPRSRRLRPAGPPPRRMSIPANDDLPSIGGLIYALQQRPSKSPFLVALIASLSWLLIGGFLAYGIVSAQAQATGTGFFSNPGILAAAVGVLVPIAIFWFLALLVWRAQELRLMASAMTEVAVRLAEPDKLAEQSVASLGQTIRRQVAAMNDAISRAIGRAGELEAMVHNEVSALERSYSENETRVRSLISELATEREALANNSQRVSESLKGVGAQIARDLSTVSGAIDKKLSERSQQLTTQVQGAQDKLTASVSPLIDRLGEEQLRLTHIVEAAAKNLSNLDSMVGTTAIALDKTLRERGEALTVSLATRIKALEGTFGQGAALLDKTLQARTETLDASLSERLQALDHKLIEQAGAAEKIIGERFDAIGASFSQRTAMADKMLAEHTKAVETSLTESTKLLESSVIEQTSQLQESLYSNAAALKSTAEEVATQSTAAAEVLTGQTETLRDVSRGLLEQIHSLTQRFENQGQAILTAARALDSSNAKIDSILESRHHSIVGLLESVNSKAQELDSNMQSYAGMVDSALTEAEQRAKQVGTTLARDTSAQAQQALTQIERLKEHAQAHSSRAVGELKSSFETVMTQIARQLEQMRGQFDHTTRTMRDTARQTATDLDAVRVEMQRRMESLPKQTLQATAAMRKAITEQIREMEQLTPLMPPQGPAGGGDPYRQQQQPAQPPRGPMPSSQDLPLAPYEQGQPPNFRNQDGDINTVTSNLANQLTGAGHLDPGRATRTRGAEPSRDQWSVGDLLQRASDSEERYFAEGPAPQQPQAPRRAAPGRRPQSFKLDDMARVIDQRTAAEVWRRYRNGERGILGKHLYSADGQATFDEISGRYGRDAEFRATVDRYIADFERLVAEAEQTDPGGRVLNNYLMSETGRVYLVLAHASGRLR
jgi:hypothetical protein